MIRSLMGTLIHVGKGRIEPQKIKKILDSKDRSKAHVTAPGKGLFLMEVFYENETMEKFQLTNLPFQGSQDNSLTTQ